MSRLPSVWYQPPELEIRDIGELTMDQFRGIFRLTYDGDAHIVLRTKVQVRIPLSALRVRCQLNACLFLAVTRLIL